MPRGAILVKICTFGTSVVLLQSGRYYLIPVWQPLQFCVLSQYYEVKLSEFFAVSLPAGNVIIGPEFCCPEGQTEPESAVRGATGGAEKLDYAPAQ